MSILFFLWFPRIVLTGSKNQLKNPLCNSPKSVKMISSFASSSPSALTITVMIFSLWVGSNWTWKVLSPRFQFNSCLNSYSSVFWADQPRSYFGHCSYAVLLLDGLVLVNGSFLIDRNNWQFRNRHHNQHILTRLLRWHKRSQTYHRIASVLVAVPYSGAGFSSRELMGHTGFIS